MADYVLTAGADIFPVGEDVSGDDRIYGLGGDDILAGGAGADLLDGGDGFDTVTYAGATVGIFVNPMSRVTRNDGTGDTFVSIERFVLSGFNDYFRADQSFTAGFLAEGGAGNDRIYATDFSDTLEGGEGDDQLAGGAGSDIVRGGEGNDSLNGEEGQDELFGGAGDDLLQGGTNNDRIDGGDGFDTMILYTDPSAYELSLEDDGSVKILRLAPEYEDRGTTTLNGSFDIVTNVEQLRFYDGTVFDLAAWVAANAPPAGFHVIRGTQGADTLVGTSGQDAIYGRGGGDSIAGGEGDDLLSGGHGADAFDGGDGFDTVTYANASGAVLVNIPRGPFDSEDPKHEAYGDTFTSVERVELSAFDDTLYWKSASGVAVFGGIGKDTIVGDAGADQLDGGTGDDILNSAGDDDELRGGDGADKLYGGAGDDLLDGGLGSDRIDGGLGTDTLVFEGRSAGVSIGFIPGEDQGYYSIEIFRLTDHDDQIRLYASTNDEGHAGVSDVYAGAGNDLVDGGVIAGDIYGEDGDDILKAGHYGSFLDGGAGDDSLHSAWGGDLIEGGEGSDTVSYGRARSEYHIERDGDAIVVAHMASGWVDRLTGVEFLSFPHPLFLEQVVISTLPGGEESAPMQMGSLAADMLVGDAVLANALFGLSGADGLTGGGEADMMSGGEDDDAIAGAAGDDSLYGGAGNDRLDGADGADKMLAGAGTDALAGGAGNDILYFGADFSPGDVADGGAGRDALVLQGNVTAVLTDASVTGIESISIQSGANSFFGDTANNFYDTNLTTADGSVASGEQLIVNASSLRAGEDFTFDGSAETDGRFLVYGGHGVDILKGGAGADVFFFEGQRWGAGDRVDGGGGRDSLAISAGNGLARIEFAADALANIESISLNNLFASDPSQKPSYELVLHNGNVAPGATLIVNGNSIPLGQVVILDGRAVEDGHLMIFAGGGHDTVTGGDGADLILGSGGADALGGGAGADTFRYDLTTDSTASASDLIGDFATGTDKIDLSRIDSNIFAGGNQAFSWIGSSAFAGTGASSAGQLRLYEHGGYQWIEGDTNGDGTADLVIVLQTGTAPLVQGDFLL